MANRVSKTNCDFSGWATRYDIKCADGRTIKPGAFADCDGEEVTLVYGHSHDNLKNVLGHGLLEARPEGVRLYGLFNKTDSGERAKELVANGDIKSLSIYANNLRQRAGDVLHGVIREVSLVLSPANKGAYIDYPVIQHGDDDDVVECYIYMDDVIDVPDSHLEHSVDSNNKGENEMAENKEQQASGGEKTVQDVFNELTEEQKKVVYFLIGKAVEEAQGGGSDDEDEDDGEVEHGYFGGEDDMYYNAFEQDGVIGGDVLSHDAFMALQKDCMDDARKFGSLKDAVIEHAAEYGIENIDYLFPDAKALSEKPEFIARRKEWVSKIIGHTHKTPFARIKTQFADITADEARAKGYIKGSRKKEEVFKLLKRVTDSTTIYKKQKIDRQDAIKMTFDHAAWMREEMKVMLEEESARAILVGDGRNESDEDKINELCIRPIVSDDDLYTIKYTVTVGNDETEEDAIIDASIKVQDDYQGSGSISMFMDTTTVTKLLLVKDKMGHRIYKSLAELATAMSVDEIVKMPKGIMPSNVYGIGVDLADYNVGTDAGGEVNWFDNFDIDFNQYKYLAETMFSGALVKPYSAFVLKKNV